MIGCQIADQGQDHEDPERDFPGPCAPLMPLRVVPDKGGDQSEGGEQDRQRHEMLGHSAPSPSKYDMDRTGQNPDEAEACSGFIQC